jgi:hypothetical protein
MQIKKSECLMILSVNIVVVVVIFTRTFLCDRSKKLEKGKMT